MDTCNKKRSCDPQCQRHRGDHQWRHMHQGSQSLHTLACFSFLVLLPNIIKSQRAHSAAPTTTSRRNIVHLMERTNALDKLMEKTPHRRFRHVALHGIRVVAFATAQASQCTQNLQLQRVCSTELFARPTTHTVIILVTAHQNRASALSITISFVTERSSLLAPLRTQPLKHMVRYTEAAPKQTPIASGRILNARPLQEVPPTRVTRVT